MIPNPGDKRKKFMTREWFIEQQKRSLPQKLTAGRSEQSRIFGKLTEDIDAATVTSSKVTVEYGKLREWIYSGRNLVQSDIYHYVGNPTNKDFKEDDFVFADLYQTEFLLQGEKAKTITLFTLTAALTAGGTASATSAEGTITVTDYAGNIGESGDQGIAWKEEDTYYVIEIKHSGTSDVELYRFTLTADLAAGGTATATTTPATTTITVTDWAGNPAKSGSKGVAWKDGDTYWVIEIERPGPQFIMCKLSSGGYSFGGASGTTFNVTDIAGVDAPWTGASTIEVENPLKIKVWMTTCLIKCQFNISTGDWEVIAATQEHVLHGVRINETCVFQQLTYNGAENWNTPTDWDSRTSTSADWVTSVYIIDGSLVYDKRCQEGVVIADLTDCETPPEPPPE